MLNIEVLYHRRTPHLRRICVYSIFATLVQVIMGYPVFRSVVFRQKKACTQTNLIRFQSSCWQFLETKCWLIYVNMLTDKINYVKSS